MFNPLRWLYRKFCTKNTTIVQFESLRLFMRHLGYPEYTQGRFIGSGITGCSIINYRTAVRLHNTQTWRNVDGGMSYADFNPKMLIPTQALRTAIHTRIVYKCKQQLVEKYGEPTIKTQSHVIHFHDRGYAKATGLL